MKEKEKEEELRAVGIVSSYVFYCTGLCRNDLGQLNYGRKKENFQTFRFAFSFRFDRTVKQVLAL